MDTVKETRNKAGPEKAAWKRDRCQLDLKCQGSEVLGVCLPMFKWGPADNLGHCLSSSYFL